MKRSSMVANDGRRRIVRTRRLLWSLLASLAINGAFLVAYPHLAFRPGASRTRTAVVAVLRVERRTPTPRPTPPPPTPRPTPTPPPVLRTPVPATPAPATPTPVVRTTPRPAPTVRPTRRAAATPRDVSGAPSMSFGHRQGVRLRMPLTYDTQDLANGAAADVSKYVDFKKAKGAFVPQVWVVHLNTSFLSGPTLADAVHDITTSLEPDGAKISASKPQRVCHGKYPAWFLAYSQPGQDLPGDYENILFVEGDTMYRVMYSRPLGQAEDPQTRAAMNGLCPK